MERLKKVSTIIIAMVVLVLLSGAVNAAKLTLKTIVDKSEVTVGDEVKVTVDWAEGMQAVDFSLSYDSSKLDYVGADADLEGDYVNDTTGKLIVSWFSMGNKEKTKAEFRFKAKAEGTSDLQVNVEGAFATGEMVSPESYDVTTAGTTAITVKAKEVAEEPEQPSTEDVTPEQPVPEEPSTEPTTPEQPTTGVTTNETETKPTTIPHAGPGANLAIGIITLSAIIVFAYIQNKRYKGI